VRSANMKNAKKREIEIGEFDGKEFGSDLRAEEWAMGPFSRETFSVIGVKMC